MIGGVPAGYATAAQQSQRVGFSCDLLEHDLSRVVRANIPISGGSLKVADDRVRRTGKIEIITDGELVPDSTSHLMHPYQHRFFRLFATVVAEAGTFKIELANLRMLDLDVQVTPGGSLLTATLADDAFENLAGRVMPFAPDTLDRPAENLDARCFAVGGYLIYPPLVNPRTIPITVPAGQVLFGPKAKTYADLCTLAEGYGWGFGVESTGRYGFRAAADAGTFYFGGAGARTATVVRQSWGVRDLVNASAFLVNSSEQGTALGKAYDTTIPLINPQSTSYRWGVRWAYTESRDVAAADAQTSAARQLQGTAGGSRRVTFSAVPDFRIEGGDRVVLDLPAQKCVGTFIVESVDYPFQPGSEMNVTCQEVRGA